MNWDHWFIHMARGIASYSDDQSTKVGCVAVDAEHTPICFGYNRLPRGVADSPERRTRPVKYSWTCHAEESMVANAARVGAVLDGATIYLNWEPYPCPPCARMVITAGISEIVGPNRKFPGVLWQESFACSKAMLEEAGVKVRVVVA